ncbi:hypothetical protein Trydic_g2253 [Trypoxylus dichotomus]
MPKRKQLMLQQRFVICTLRKEAEGTITDKLGILAKGVDYWQGQEEQNSFVISRLAFLSGIRIGADENQLSPSALQLAYSSAGFPTAYPMYSIGIGIWNSYVVSKLFIAPTHLSGATFSDFQRFWWDLIRSRGRPVLMLNATLLTASEVNSCMSEVTVPISHLSSVGGRGI